VAIRSVGGAQLGADLCICLAHLSAVGLDVLRQQPAELAGKDCFHSFADQVESGLQTVYQLGHEGTYLVKAMPAKGGINAGPAAGKTFSTP
jgi:hypothetical protein